MLIKLPFVSNRYTETYILALSCACERPLECNVVTYAVWHLLVGEVGECELVVHTVRSKSECEVCSKAHRVCSEKLILLIIYI